MLRKSKTNCVVNLASAVTDEPDLPIGSPMLGAKCGVLSTRDNFVDPVSEVAAIADHRSPTIKHCFDMSNRQAIVKLC